MPPPLSTAGTMSPGVLSGASTAMSFSGVDDTTWALVLVPSPNVTSMSDASSTTWFAVMIWPWALTTTPLPILLSLSLATLVSMNTSDGAMIRYTFAPYSGVAGVDVGGVAAAGRFVLPSDDQPSPIAYSPSSGTSPTAARADR